MPSATTFVQIFNLKSTLICTSVAAEEILIKTKLWAFPMVLIEGNLWIRSGESRTTKIAGTTIREDFENR